MSDFIKKNITKTKFKKKKVKAFHQKVKVSQKFPLRYIPSWQQRYIPCMYTISILYLHLYYIYDLILCIL